MNNLLDSFSILKDVLTLNDKKTHSNKNIKKSTSRDDTDIYESSQLKKILKQVNEKGILRMDKARDPRKSGIINPNIRRQGTNRKAVEHFGNIKKYNPKKDVVSDSEFSDDSSLASNASSKSSYLFKKTIRNC